MRAGWYVYVTAAVLLTACSGTQPTPTPTLPPPGVSITTMPDCDEPSDVDTIPLPTVPTRTVGGWALEPDYITPYYSSDFVTRWAAQLVMPGLAEWNPSGKLVPVLAESVPTVENGGISPDGRTVTWRLRPCLYWSDGEPLTAHDVVFTWQVVMDPASGVVSRAGYAQIESVTAEDDRTVVITFAAAYSRWGELFTQGPVNAGAILPAHIFEDEPDLTDHPEIRQPLVGAGPYLVVEWLAGESMTLRANPNYFGAPPSFDLVEIRFLDPATALEAMRAGDVDWYVGFDEADLPQLLALAPAVRTAALPTAEFEHYFFNLGADGFCPLRDARVRRALLLGLDRQAMVDTHLDGLTIVPATQWHSGPWAHPELEPVPYDPDQARQLLDEAGYVDHNDDGVREGECEGEIVSLDFQLDTTDSPLRMAVAVQAQQQLAGIGVMLQPTHHPPDEFFATYAEGGLLPNADYDLAAYTTQFYPDPWTDNFDCDQVPAPDTDGRGNNLYHLCDPELDALFDEALMLIDPRARREAFFRVQERIYEQTYVLPLYSRLQIIAYNEHFDPGEVSYWSGWHWQAEAWTTR